MQTLALVIATDITTWRFVGLDTLSYALLAQTNRDVWIETTSWSKRSG